MEKDTVFTNMKKAYYNITERVQRRDSKMIEGLENLPCEERSKQLRSFLPREEKAQGDLIIQYLEQLQRGRRLSPYKVPHGEDKGQWIQVSLGEISS